MAEPPGAGAADSPGEGSAANRAAMILTPDQRVRVFISSTLEELAAERKAAQRAIRRLHLVPVWYESGARPHPPRSMYAAYLAQSQVFVGIYWQRYGWVAPGMEISGLEDEYRLAAGKPMLLYLKRPAPDQEPRLTAMIDGIRAAGTVSYRTFATAGELERLLADDLAVLLSESFAGAAAGIGPPASLAGPGEPREADLPAGTVTFLLTDIEGSTRLWETVPEAMEAALELHNRLLVEVIEDHGGVVVTSRGEGDSFFAVFPGAVAAVEAAGACQLALKQAAWPAGAALGKTAKKLSPSPREVTTTPPWPTLTSVSSRLCRSSATSIASGTVSHSRVEPSMPVKRKVTVPVGSSVSPGPPGPAGEASALTAAPANRSLKSTARSSARSRSSSRGVAKVR